MPAADLPWPIAVAVVAVVSQVRPPLPVGRQLCGGPELSLFLCVREFDGVANLLHDGSDSGEGRLETGGGGGWVCGECVGGGGVRYDMRLLQPRCCVMQLLWSLWLQQYCCSWHINALIFVLSMSFSTN